MKLTQSLWASIVAVHGIGAHPDRTWETGNVNWLRDIQMLPSIVPTARIMRYGYESRWYGDNPIQQSVESVSSSLLQDLRNERTVSHAQITSSEHVDCANPSAYQSKTSYTHWTLLRWACHSAGCALSQTFKIKF